MLKSTRVLFYSSISCRRLAITNGANFLRPMNNTTAAFYSTTSSEKKSTMKSGGGGGGGSGGVGGGVAATSAVAGESVALRVRDDGIAVVLLDSPGAKVNTLSRAMSGEFEKKIRAALNDAKVRGVVIMSAKSNNFIAGADINDLSSCKSAVELQKLGSSAAASFRNLLRESEKPVVAAINGACLGGGLELAMWCNGRIASLSKSTKLGLPEVMLGLLPGAGGTQLLPSLVGVQAALPMLLTGKQLDAKRALRAGLVDSVADKYALEDAAASMALSLSERPRAKAAKQRRLSTLAVALEFALTRTGYGRSFVMKKAREQVLKATGGKYPAPLRILEVVERGLAAGEAAGLEAEARAFGELGMSSESRALVSIFHGQNACKKNRFLDGSAAVLPVSTIGIVGAGLMGAGIAAVSASRANLRVLLKDTKSDALARGEMQVFNGLQQRVKRRQISVAERDRVASRVLGFADDDATAAAAAAAHFARADMIVEAVFEDLSVKHAVLGQIERMVPKECVLATNTSALPIADVAAGLERREQVIGMHYFSPVERMPLLEIIPHAQTSQEVIARAFNVGLAQGKTIIVVKDVPGFYVNRSLGPYMAEALALALEDNVPLESIDKAMREFGFPVGPVTLVDEVGVDVAAHVNQFLAKHLGVRMSGAEKGAELLKKMLDANMRGRKSGVGFYTYEEEKQQQKKKKKKVGDGGKKLNPNLPFKQTTAATTTTTTMDMDEIQFRCVARFVNEAALCLQDGIIASPTDGDIGAVFGIGFPPFIGGPFRYVDGYGIKKFVDRMNALAQKRGRQFEPAPLLVEMAKSNKKFF